MVQREVGEEKEAWITWYIWLYSFPFCSWVLTTFGGSSPVLGRLGIQRSCSIWSVRGAEGESCKLQA